MTAEQQGWQTVRQLIRDAGVGMLTTVGDRSASLTARPMLALLLDDDPAVYFLTHSSSAKVRQIAAHPHVGVTFTAPNGTFLAITGRAQTAADSHLVERLWNPTYRAWFPDGATDRDMVVLRVEISQADYWDPPGSRVARLIEVVEALVTGSAYENPKHTVRPGTPESDAD